MSDNISEKILLIVGEIKGEVKGINNRLDRINGTLANHDDRINKNESANDRQQGKATAYSVITALIVSVIAMVIGYFKLKK